MSTMPYWLNKTREMIAMDRYFGVSDEAKLIDRYNKAIGKIRAGIPGSSDALNKELKTGKPPSDSFLHFGKDWLNKNNPSSGGDFWPHVPTFTIITWFEKGILAACQKGLGWTELVNQNEDAAAIFKSETDDSLMDPSELEDVLPLSTCWVCTSPPGTGTVEVDAVRGPSVVQLVISTPWPKTMQSRLWGIVKPVIDEEWVRIHGGPGPSELNLEREVAAERSKKSKKSSARQP